MKTRFLALMALAFGMVSCQNDFDGASNNVGGEVDFQLSVNAVELATRAGDTDQQGMDSAFGAIDYLQGATKGDDRQDWDDVDLRYTLEVYDVADDYAGKTPVKDRQVIIVDEYQPVVFDLRLVPNRDYHFVVFADFVANGTSLLDPADQLKVEGIRHQIGETLADITVVNEAINDEVADAYFATKNIKVTNSATQDILLKRPYGKVRVIATDLAELNLNVNPKSAVVEYEAFNPNKFNAVTGDIDGEYTIKQFATTFADGVRDDMGKHYYTTAGYEDETATAVNGTTVRNSIMTLFTDYILATDTQEAIHFTMTVNDEEGKEIKTTSFYTDIPVQRNYLTTVIGNVLTTATHIEVSIDDNFANVNDGNEGNDYDFTLLEVLMNGGEFVLTEDMTITEPTNLRGDAVIFLNGHTLNYVASKDDTKHTIMTRVENGSSLTFYGEGAVKATGYIASANEGGKIFVKGGNYTSEGCTLFQANGGEVYISGGEFKAAEYDGDYRYTLNHVDSKKNIGKIEVSGGKFFKYDPAKSESENPMMNFVKEGFGSFAEGDYYVIRAVADCNFFEDHAEVYTAKGLGMWAYLVNFGDGETNKDYKDYDLHIMADITIPECAVVKDDVNRAYIYDKNQSLDGTNSNWIPVRNQIEELEDAYSGHIHGNYHTISGLEINHAGNYVGFIGFMFDGGSITNLTFVDAKINGNATVGVAAGRVQDDIIVDNVHVINSTVKGTNNVGGVIGYNYSRVGGAQGQNYKEGPAIVRNCSTDVETEVICSGSNAGGIVGNNYGATIYNCKNYADVTGVSNVGGIVGYTRDYHHNADGYIVACTTYPEATITATNGEAGGIAGYTLADNQHTNSYMHIVACTSLSKVVGNTSGCIIGRIHHGQHTAGCVAVKNGATKLYGKNKPTTESHITDAILYDAVGDATQADVDALNAAIAHYKNLNPPTHAICNFTWTLVNGFPVLQ